MVSKQTALGFGDRGRVEIRENLSAALTREGWHASGLSQRLRFDDESALGEFFRVLGRDGEPFLFGCLAPPSRWDDAETELARRIEANGLVSVALILSPDGTEVRTLRWHHGLRRMVRGTRIEPWAPPSQSVPLFTQGGLGHRSLRPVDRRVEDMLFQTHSHMRDVDGLHAPEAVDELCKVLFVKIFDERHTTRGATYVLQAGSYGSKDEYACVARRLFRKALLEEEDRLGMERGSLSRVWGALNISDGALVRCLDQLASYSFSTTKLDVKGRAFQNVLVPAMRSGMGQYFTPERVGRLMISVLAPTSSERTIDPFAGSAHFLSLAARSWKVAEGAAFPSTDALFGIEKSERMMRIGWTDLMLHEVGGVRLACGDALGAQAQFPEHAFGSFDVVVTNPPFGSVLREDAIAQLGTFETSVGRGTTPVEILAFERSIAFLRPGGRIGIVLPDGVLGNQRALSTRRWAARQLAIRAIVSLPSETFSPFGANVKASILFARRLRPGECIPDQQAVFLARLDDVGHDAAGRVTADTEVSTVTSALRAFLETEGW